MSAKNDQPELEQTSQSSNGFRESFSDYVNRRSRMTEQGLMGGQVPYIDTDEGDYDVEVGP